MSYTYLQPNLQNYALDDNSTFFRTSDSYVKKIENEEYIFKYFVLVLYFISGLVAIIGKSMNNRIVRLK